MKTNKIIIGIFTLFLSVAMLINLLPDKEFSDLENRYLSSAVLPSIETILDGSFMEDFETYIEDQYPLRNFLIKLKNQMEITLLKQEINATYIGKDGYYFVKNNIDNSEQLIKNLSYINEFIDKVDVDVKFLPIFSSYTIYEELLPKYAEVFDELVYLDLVKEYLDVEVIDSLENIMSHKDEQIYFKSDHHWTNLGAYYAYLKVCEAYDLEPITLEERTKVTSDNLFYGTLYSRAPLFGYVGDEFTYYDSNNKFTVTITEKNEVYDSLYFEEHMDSKDQYVTFLNGNQAEVIIEGGNPDGEKLLILKDSFTHALAPLLADHFSQICLIDLRYYHGSIKEYVEMNEIDEVLFAYNLAWMSEDKNLYQLKK